jgi:hypothetical protein
VLRVGAGISISPCAGISVVLGNPGAVCDSTFVSCVATPASNAGDSQEMLFCPAEFLLPSGAANPNAMPQATIGKPVTKRTRRIVSL